MIRRISRSRWLAAGAGFGFGLATALVSPAQPTSAPPVEVRTVAAAASFNGEAFTYTMTLRHAAARHRCYALSYPSPLKTALTNNNVVPAEYYVPSNLKPGEARRPAMICLHILNGNFELERMLCTVLAESGVPAILFKLPYYGERSPAEGRQVLLHDVGLFAECIRQAGLDVRRTVDVLASRPEVDPARIGVSGISLGAILAASACGAEPRLQRANLILGGGDLRRIIGSAREAGEMRASLARLAPATRQAVEAALDRAEPLAHAAALRRLAEAGRLMMVNASEDEVVPPDCTRRLAEAVGMKDKVIWLEGMGHYTALAALPRIIKDTVAFFGQDLPPGIIPPPVPPAQDLPPVAALAAFMQQVSTLLGRAPAPGHCHYSDLQATLVLEGQPTNTYRFALVRGESPQFHLQAGPLPGLGSVNLGCGDTPWMVAESGKLLVASQTNRAPFSVTELLNTEQLGRLQLAAGATAALAAAPEAFAEYLQVTETAGPTSERVLTVTLNQKAVKGSGQLRLQRETLTPLSLTFRTAGLEGTVTFRLWSLDAVGSPELYRAPAGRAAQEVPRADLLQRFADTLRTALATRLPPDR